MFASKVRKRLLSAYFVFVLLSAGFAGMLVFEGAVRRCRRARRSAGDAVRGYREIITKVRRVRELGELGESPPPDLLNRKVGRVGSSNLNWIEVCFF